jgi:hypothetical protein
MPAKWLMPSVVHQEHAHLQANAIGLCKALLAQTGVADRAVVGYHAHRHCSQLSAKSDGSTQPDANTAATLANACGNLMLDTSEMNTSQGNEKAPGQEPGAGRECVPRRAYACACFRRRQQ